MIWLHRFRWTLVTLIGCAYAFIVPALFYRRRK